MCQQLRRNLDGCAVFAVGSSNTVLPKIEGMGVRDGKENLVVWRSRGIGKQLLRRSCRC